MIETPLISIIIPVYNAEKYLHTCLDGILGQSYQNLEVLVVLDGSTDQSPEIARDYEAKDSRLHAIMQENGGVSKARNTGIEHSKGEYIVFIDADDMVHPEFIERLYSCMMSEKSDIVLCNVACVEEWKTLDDCMKMNLINTDAVENMSGRSLVDRTIFDDLGVVGIVPVNKLFKRELWEEIRFPLGIRHEDESIIYKILYPLKKCSIIQENLYFYRRDNGSFMDNANWNDESDLADIVFDQAKYFKECNDMELYGKRLTGALQYLAMFIIRYKDRQDLKDNILARKKYFRKMYCKELLHTSADVKQKLALGLFCVSPGLYGKILQKKGIA